MQRAPCLMPVGLIEDSNDNNVSFLTLPVTHDDLTVDAELIMWNQIQGHVAKFRLIVTELVGNVGSARIIESDIPVLWPDNIHAYGAGNPLYIADEDTYEPKWDRHLWVQSPEQADLLNALATDHQQQTSIPPSWAAAVQRPPEPGDDNYMQLPN